MGPGSTSNKFLDDICPAEFEKIGPVTESAVVQKIQGRVQVSKVPRSILGRFSR